MNATTEQAAEDTRNEEESDQNKVILTHSYLDSSPVSESSGPATGAGASYVLGHDDAVTTEEPAASTTSAQPETMGHELVIEPPVAPVVSTPADLGLPMPPPLPDFSAQPAPGTAYAFDAVPAAPGTTQPNILGDILAPEPPAASTQPTVTPPSAPNDPGQFQIPGQR